TYGLADGLNGGLTTNYSALANNTLVPGIIIVQPITISLPTIATRQYNGNAHVTTGMITVGVVTGLVPPESLTIVASGTDYASKNVGNYTSTVSYAISNGLNGGLATNYSSLSSDAGIAGSIIQRVLSISAPSIASKIYYGTPTVGTITAGTLSNLVSPETVTVTPSGTDYASRNIGTYSSTISYLLGNGINGGLATNYSLANGTANGTITPKNLTVTGVTADNKVYDGLNTATVTGTAVLVGIVAPDVVTLGLPTGYHFTTVTVANGKTVLTNTPYTIGGAGVGNYTLLNQPANLSANITPKDISITGLTVNSKVYDGGTTATLGGTGNLVGVVGLDAGNVALGATYVANFADPHVNTNIAVTVTSYALSGSAAFNYHLLQPIGLTGNITKKPLTITGTTITSREYDGTANHGSINPGTLHGLVGTELLGTTLATAPDYFGNYPGTYPTTITYTLVSAVGAPSATAGLASDYSLGTSFINGIVTKKALTYTGSIVIADKVYDGTTSTGTITLGGSLSGFINSETVNVTATGVFADKNVNPAKSAVVSFHLTDGTHGGLAQNYSVPDDNTHFGAIIPKHVTVNVIANDKVFNGSATATIASATLNGIVAADAALVTLDNTGITAATFNSPSVGHHKLVTLTGIYALNGLLINTNNYAIDQPTNIYANITNASGEIGDYVWSDDNLNGVQDATEAGLANVTVQLVQGPTVLATTTTDASGYYTFSPADVAGFFLDNASHYTIRIPNVTGASAQAELGGRFLTSWHSGSGVHADWYDNDGIMVGDNADISITSGAANSTNFTYDFGFAGGGGAGGGGGGGVGGGGGGGLESKDLGDAVGNRIFDKAVNSLQGPIDYSKLTLINASTNRNRIAGIGTALTLTDLLPKQIPGGNYKVFNSTPADITAITNAKDVMSLDFTLNNQAKAVAFATKTQGEVYDHTKAICDRLKGSELLGIQNIMVNNVKLVRYDLKNTEGQTEYAFSFAVGAKSGRSNYTIQSNWLNKDYTPDEVMYNVQLWAETPELVLSMATDIINRLGTSLPVKEVLSANGLPKTYITKGIRAAENIVLNITNNTASTNGYFEMLEKANEQSSGFTTKQVPFTIKANGKATINVPASDNYEATINMYLNGVLQDQVFMADGNWSVIADPANSTLKSFKVINDPKRVIDNKEDFLLFRNVQLEAATSNFVSMYKILRGSGTPQDLTGYRSFQFTADGSGATMFITLVKAGVTNWADQYSLTLPLSGSTKDYKISLDDFVSTASKAKIDPKDISMVIFGFAANGGRLSNVTANISNVAFSKTDFAYLNSLQSKEINVYPNPAKGGSFVASFKAPSATTLTMSITDANSGKLIFRKLVNATVGTNSIPVHLDLTTGITTYILSLEGASGRYTPKKVLMEK
ncbi:MAG: YDG domain-containing protein, partial [Bacteroidota bacterium]